MQIRVLFFASLRERVGHDQEVIELPEGADLKALAANLRARLPALAPALPHVRFAVNQEFAPPTLRLRAQDEVALIPPVSGG